METILNFVKQRVQKRKVRQTSPLVEFHDFFKCEGVFLRFGIPFFRKFEGSEKSRRFWKIHFRVVKFFLALVAVLLLMNIFRSMSTNPIMTIEAFGFFGIFVLIFLKVYVMFYKYRATIEDIILKLYHHFPHHGIDQLKFNVKSHLLFLNVFTRLCLVIDSSSFALISTVPAMTYFYDIWNGINAELKPIMPLYVPFNEFNFFAYLAVSIFESWAVFMAMLVYMSTDLLYCSLVGILAMEFEILGKTIAEIDCENGEKEAMDELRIMIDIHLELIDISEKLEKIFSPFLLINVFSSIGVISIAIFYFISGASGYLMVKYFAALPGVMLQIFMHCFYADRLTELSRKLSDEVYETSWYNGSQKFQKAVLTLMWRSQKPQKMTAFCFADMSLKLFSWLIEKSYSFYSILIVFYKT